MLTYREIQSMVSRARAIAGRPPFRLWAWSSVRSMKMISTKEYKSLDGIRLYKNIIAINPCQSKGCALNTIWHEIGHIVFKTKPHYWIELFAQRMSGFDYRGYSHKALGSNALHINRIKHPVSTLKFFPKRNDLIKETQKRVAKLKAVKG